ncbi:MAG: hypothetical protein AAGK09_04615 [Planctomycetota bacterium]
MTSPADPQIGSPRQALIVARGAWAVMTLGAIVAAIVFYAATPQPSQSPVLGRWVSTWVPAAAVILAPFLGHVIRQQMFKAGWSGQAVSPKAYVGGTIGYLAPVEAALLLTCAMMAIGGHRPGHLLVIAVGVAFMALNFPTGSSMRPPSDGDGIGNYDA